MAAHSPCSTLQTVRKVNWDRDLPAHCVDRIHPDGHSVHISAEGAVTFGQTIVSLAVVAPVKHQSFENRNYVLGGISSLGLEYCFISSVKVLTPVL